MLLLSQQHQRLCLCIKKLSKRDLTKPSHIKALSCVRCLKQRAAGPDACCLLLTYTMLRHLSLRGSLLGRTEATSLAGRGQCSSLIHLDPTSLQRRQPVLCAVSSSRVRFSCNHDEVRYSHHERANRGGAWGGRLEADGSSSCFIVPAVGSRFTAQRAPPS